MGYLPIYSLCCWWYPSYPTLLRQLWSPHRILPLSTHGQIPGTYRDRLFVAIVSAFAAEIISIIHGVICAVVIAVVIVVGFCCCCCLFFMLLRHHGRTAFVDGCPSAWACWLILRPWLWVSSLVGLGEFSAGDQAGEVSSLGAIADAGWPAGRGLSLIGKWSTNGGFLVGVPPNHAAY